MLATLVAQVPIGSQWSFELKWDGIRAALIVDDDQVTILSRNGTNITSWFPELSGLSKHIRARRASLDGEIILRDGSVASFNELLPRVRARRRRPTDDPVTLVVFDVTAVDEEPSIDLPLDARRAKLLEIVQECPQLVMSRVFDDGAELYAKALQHGLEGVVGKIRTSTYTSGRSRDWIKVKAPDAASRHDWSGTANKL